MALTSSSIGDIQNAAQDGFPFLMGDHLLRDKLDIANDGAYWGTDGSIVGDEPGGSDNVDPASPADATVVNSYFRLIDGKGVGGFAPDLSGGVGAQPTLYLHADLSDAAAANDADTVILFYDTGSFGDTFDLAVRFRDSGSTYTVIASAADLEPGIRAVWIPLTSIWSEIGGVRLQFTSNGADFDVGSEPRVLELFVGRRSQLDHGVLRPLAVNGSRSQVEDFFADSGDHQRIVLHRQRYEGMLRFATTENGFRYGFDGVSTFEAFRNQTLGVTRSFCWVPRPYISASLNREEVYLGVRSDGAALDITETGRVRHDVELPFRETPPFFLGRG